ncbi:MAG: hypothetical protein ACXVEF_25140 [Polyangiales bacterium]
MRTQASPAQTKMPGAMWAYLFYGVLVGLPLATVGIVFAFFVQREIAIVATLPREGGPAAFEGAIGHAEGARRTPMGVEVAGWSGLLRSTSKHGKTSSTTVLCKLGELDDLTLGGRALMLDADAVPTDDALELLTAVRNPTKTSVVAGEIVSTEALPAEVIARCPVPALKENETRTWVEHRFARGDTVTFIGCRATDRLVSCADRSPANGTLFRGTRRALVGRLLAATLGMTAGVIVISLFFAIVAAVTTLSHLRRQEVRS